MESSRRAGRAVRVVGRGRAGRSLAGALEACGWDVAGFVGAADDPTRAASGVDAVVLAVPDDAVASVAHAVEPDPAVAVLHLSGSLGLDVLAPHTRRASLHPLVPLPDPVTGARRLRSGVTFAVAGDALATEMASALGGRVVEVPDAQRAAYHAAASIAANHVVALLGQVERVAASAGLPLEAFLGLVRAAVDDVSRVGPAAALTGPAARGDWATLARHRDALDPAERPAYQAMVALARRLVESDPVALAVREEPEPAAADPTEAVVAGAR